MTECFAVDGQRPLPPPDRYEAPRVEVILTPEELEREAMLGVAPAST